MYLERIQLLSEEKYKDIVTKNEQEQVKKVNCPSINHCNRSRQIPQIIQVIQTI